MDVCMLVAIDDRLFRIDIIILFIVLNINPYFHPQPPLPLPVLLQSPQKWCTLILPYMQMKHQTRVYFMFSEMRCSQWFNVYV